MFYSARYSLRLKCVENSHTDQISPTQNGLYAVWALAKCDCIRVNADLQFSGDERGLLGMVFHPNFTTDRRVFTYYVVKVGAQQTARISQWIARSTRAVRRGSERILLDIPQPSWNHNGGQVSA